MSPPSVAFESVGVVLDDNAVLRDVSLAVEAGSWLALIGPNGAGKTTLLRCITGLQPHTGLVRIGDVTSANISNRQRSKHVASVPQNPLIPHGVSVFDYVLLGRTPHQGLRFSASRHDHDLVSQTLLRLELRSLEQRSVETLSGGERQRVVIARALAQQAPVLILDEPTTGLDIGHQLDVLELISELRSERAVTVIGAIHDLGLAGQFADNVALLSDGQLVGSGTPANVLTQENLRVHYGVEAEIALETDGRVGVTVRRRTATSIGQQ